MEIISNLFSETGPPHAFFWDEKRMSLTEEAFGRSCHWGMGRDQSLFWAHLFLSWVCSGKMQASADFYPTEATDHAVKGKAGHYLVKVYWVGSTEVKSFCLLPSLCLCFIEFDHDFHNCSFLKRTCIRSWTLKYNSLDSNCGPDSVGVSGEVILPSSELQCSLLQNGNNASTLVESVRIKWDKSSGTWHSTQS